jgi:hypothetical protein
LRVEQGRVRRRVVVDFIAKVGGEVAVKRRSCMRN